MDLSRDPINNAIYNGIKRGIEISLDNKCYGSALILIYAGIDAMANLGRPIDKTEVTPEDFITWVNKYIFFKTSEKITGEELYSARCAVLHTYGLESRMTRKGAARMIAYMWDKSQSPILYNKEINKNLLLLDIKTLAHEFFNGINNFLIDSFADPTMKSVVENRLEKIFITSIRYQKKV